ncbi:MAG: hypothetical protein DCC50_11950 [Acidobacteria bacterium]|nr:MAG: hypothetical protein DCC50_11950 [Acidobacteriota bacterium]
MALPASAAVERDSGWFYDSQCNSWTDPYTHAEWYGKAEIMGPGSSYYVVTPTYSSWRALNVKGMAQGGYWAATGNPYLDEEDTYAYCGDGTS